MKTYVYITVHALSDGILRGVIEDSSSTWSKKSLKGYVAVKLDPDLNNMAGSLRAVQKQHVFESFKDAVKDAENKRKKKVESLKKQLEKFKNMRFEQNTCVGDKQ